MTLELRTEWGGQNRENRFAIRKDIFANYGVSATNDVFNLSEIPMFDNGFLSISHTEKLGGYVWNHRPVGFDLEPKDRANAKTLLRVCTQEEFLAAPDPTFLWCAKEAAFKALLHSRQPKVISDIEVSWGDQTDGFETFSIKSQKETIDGLGSVSVRDDFAIATFELLKY